ncbi:MAG: FHA domain-containing protein [Deltaproteobacteria bacterium]|nr:FHA domain-containing protein [Deltaproteobacteria bacterium]
MYLEWRDVNGKMMHLQLAPDIEPVTIGRKPNVSRIFSNETTVSRDHGRIGYDEAERSYYIKDIGSANGTFVNGKQVKRASIDKGDVVRCGERFEIFLRDGSAPGERQPTGQTGQQNVVDRPRMAGPTMHHVGGLDNLRDQVNRQGGVPELQRPAQRPEPARPEPRPEPRPELRPEARPEPRAEPRYDDRAAPHAQTNRPSAQVPAVSSVEIDTLRRRIAELETDNGRLMSRATQAENRVKEVERSNVADEGLYDKYAQLKEHAQTLSRQLERTREELAQEQNRALEADARARELERRVKETEDKGADAQERIAGLKVRVTQKDRQIEELQRQYDQLDYEARALKDQVLALEAHINDGHFSNNAYERKINMLQEIIQEKEELIQEKKAELRAKEVELRQAQMGVGLSDLESEKRKLLEDFHNSIKRNDEMNERVSQLNRQIDGLKGELEAAKQAADRKPKEIDVNEHPDFKAKVREIERHREELQQAQRDLAKAEFRLEQVAAEGASAKGLQQDLERLRSRNESLEDQLRETEARVAELLERAPAPAKGAPITPELEAALEDLVEAVIAAKRNALLARDTADKLNRQRTKTGDLADTVELVFDATVVLAQDLGMQERMVKALKQDLGLT